MLERKCGDAFTVAYNPLIMLSTWANHHIELVTHSVGQLEGYVCKGSGGRDSLVKTCREVEDRGRFSDQLAASNLEQKVEEGMCERTLTECFFTGLDSRLNLVNKRDLLDPVILPVKKIGNSQAASLNLLKLRYSRREEKYDSLSLAQFAMWLAQPGDHGSIAPPSIQVNNCECL